jgi:hypothetical protein
MRSSAAEIQRQGNEAGGPPEGLPAKALLVLQDAAAGNTLVISFFENEADYEQGDRVLGEMSPPGDGMGRRVGVDRYEVAVEFRSDSLGGSDAAAT